jgi:hypothetical protein
MRIPAVVTAATVALVLTGLLGGCGEERAFRPPDAVLPLMVADPSNQAPLGEVVEVVFEVVDAEPDLSVSVGARILAQPYRVESQLMVLARVDQEFLAQGIWRDRQITVKGVVRAVNEKTGGAMPLSYSFEAASVSGPLKRRTRSVSSADLKPHTPIQIGGLSFENENGIRNGVTLAVWIRPHVTPAQFDPLLQNP